MFFWLAVDTPWSAVYVVLICCGCYRGLSVHSLWLAVDASELDAVNKFQAVFCTTTVDSTFRAGLRHT